MMSDERKTPEQLREVALERVREIPVEQHIASLYDEIAALAQNAGLVTPNLARAGMQPAKPGSLAGGFAHLSKAVAQLQQLVVAIDARQRATIDFICRLSPHQAMMFRALLETSVDLAKQELDPDKQQTGPIVAN